MEPDPLREIRDIRRQISKECGDDPEKNDAHSLSAGVDLRLVVIAFGDRNGTHRQEHWSQQRWAGK